MSRSKILDAEYDKLTGVSYLRKQSPVGIFSGIAVLENEDKDIANQWDGLRFAEYKTDLKILKAEIKREKQKNLGVEHAYKCLCQSFSEVDPVMKKLQRYYKRNLKAIQEKEELYKYLQQNYKAYTDSVIKQRRDLRCVVYNEENTDCCD